MTEAQFDTSEVKHCNILAKKLQSAKSQIFRMSEVKRLNPMSLQTKKSSRMNKITTLDFKVWFCSLTRYLDLTKR